MEYQQCGFYYLLFKRVSAGGALKVHRHIADIFDIRLCYAWKSASKWIVKWKNRQ